MKNFSMRVLRDMSAGVLVLNSNGYVDYLNKPASLIFEIPENIKPGSYSFNNQMENSKNDNFYQYILDAVYEKIDTHVGHVDYFSPSGKYYALRVSSSYFTEDTANIKQVILTISDETEIVKLQRKVDDSSKTFSAFLFALCGLLIFYAMWEFAGRPIPAKYLTHCTEVIGILLFFYMLKETSFSLHELGIATNRPLKIIKTGIIIALVCVFFLIIAKLIIRNFYPHMFRPDLPFIDFSLFGLPQVLYIFTVIIQEFLARIVIQGSLYRIMVGKRLKLQSILLSSLIFAIMHIHLGFFFMIGAATLAGLIGILYQKQKSIIGVCIVHYVVGVSGTLLSLIDH